MDEQLERIEKALGKVVDAQLSQAESLIQLTQMVGRYVEASDARMTRVEENLERMQGNLELMQGNLDVMQKNLDVLIRAITADHSNGKLSPGRVRVERSWASKQTHRATQRLSAP